MCPWSQVSRPTRGFDQNKGSNQLARFLILNYAPQLPPDIMLGAGNQWAKVAKSRIFIDLDDLSIEKLMVSITRKY